MIEMIGTERLMMGSDMPFPIGDQRADENCGGGGPVKGTRPHRSTAAWRHGYSTFNRGQSVRHAEYHPKKTSLHHNAFPFHNMSLGESTSAANTVSDAADDL